MTININDLINVTDRRNFGIESESLYKKLDVANDAEDLVDADGIHTIAY